MKNKSAWGISVSTSLEAEDAIAGLLGTIFNCSTSSYCDAEAQTGVVSVFCESKPSQIVREAIAAGLQRIKNCGLKIGAGKIKIAKVRREDWAESWKRHFKAIEIGDALLVKPSWIKKRPHKNQAVVILDPGLSFGTGQHTTTSFCLREIVRNKNGRDSALRCPDAAARRPHQPQSFLDIGTGSGILAIAAAKLGYKPVRAFDFDPEAVHVARVNARVNQVRRKLKISRDDVAKLSIHPARKYDLVCANLISNLLIAERRRIVSQLNHSGTLALAGILKSEFAQVQTAFEDSGMKLVASKSEKEWRSGSFRFTAK